MFNYHSLILWGSFRGRQEENWGSFRGWDNFGVDLGIISVLGIISGSGSFRGLYKTLIKDAFGIVKQFTSIFSSTECVCNCLPKLNHAKYLEHAFFTWENAPTWREPFANKYYNIALVLSHSLYVSMLKISIVLADSVSIA